MDLVSFCDFRMSTRSKLSVTMFRECRSHKKDTLSLGLSMAHRVKLLHHFAISNTVKFCNDFHHQLLHKL